MIARFGDGEHMESTLCIQRFTFLLAEDFYEQGITVMKVFRIMTLNTLVCLKMKARCNLAGKVLISN